MCKRKQRNKQLREFIERLPISYRLDMRDTLQDQRNVERMKQWEAKRA